MTERASEGRALFFPVIPIDGNTAGDMTNNKKTEMSPVDLGRPVPFAQEKVEEQGRLTVAKTREFLSKLIEALIVWTRRMT